MPKINPIPNGLQRHIPRVDDGWLVTEEVGVRNMENVRSRHYEMRVKQLIEDEKKRLGEEEYQRQFGRRLRGML